MTTVDIDHLLRNDELLQLLDAAEQAGSLKAAEVADVVELHELDALEQDHEFLLEGGVFTPDVVHYWIKYKRENEVDALRQRPHPFEFCMYYDI